MTAASTPPEVVAAEGFLLSTVVPVMYETDITAGIRGTGTFFQFLDRLFLVTASHLFDDGVDPNYIGVPLQARGPDVKTLGPARLYRTGEDEFDAAILEIHNDKTIAELSGGWHFLSRKHIAPPGKSINYVVSGWPSAKASTTADLISAKLVTFLTARLPQAPASAKQPVNPEYDLFLEFGRHAERFGGGIESTPDLEGISGGSVWEITSSPFSGTVWAPEHQMRVVGFQTSFRHSEYVRAKNWKAVALLFGNIDDRLGRYVQSAIFEEA